MYLRPCSCELMKENQVNEWWEYVRPNITCPHKEQNIPKRNLNSNNTYFTIFTAAHWGDE